MTSCQGSQQPIFPGFIFGGSLLDQQHKKAPFHSLFSREGRVSPLSFSVSLPLSLSQMRSRLSGTTFLRNVTFIFD
jgi:hypothetical protein